MTRITILTALSIILLSCGPTEDDKHHPYIYFHNTTNDSLYVTFTAKAVRDTYEITISSNNEEYGRVTSGSLTAEY